MTNTESIVLTVLAHSEVPLTIREIAEEGGLTVAATRNAVVYGLRLPVAGSGPRNAKTYRGRK